MMRYSVSIGAVLCLSMPIICMDKPEGKKPYDFTDLIKNNAVLVKNLVAKEQRKFCPELRQAELILQERLLVPDSRFPHDVLAFHGCDEKTREFLVLVASTNLCCHELIHAIDEKNINDAKKMIAVNRYVVNAYVQRENAEVTTPLHFVLKKAWLEEEFRSVSSKDYLAVLLHAGANPNAADANKNTPMHFVSTVEHVELLWQFGAKNNTQDRCGFTPLMQHVGMNNVPVAKLLVHAGAKIGTRTSMGTSALGLAIDVAVKEKNTELVSLLLANGADPMDMPFNYKLHDDEVTGLPEIKKIIMPYMQKCLQKALHDDDCGTIKCLISRYPWIDFMLRSIKGDTSILSWAQENCLSKKGQLLESVQIFKNCLNCALLRAVEVDDAKRLIEAGARINIRCGQATNIILMDAIRTKNTPKMFFLLRQGALVNQPVFTEGRPDDILWEKLYDVHESQHCIMCKEHPFDMEDIPCKNEHRHVFICKKCYEDRMNSDKKCPYGCGVLGEYNKESI